MMNVSDDIIIFGKTQQEHDNALEAVFNRFAKIGLTLNKKKCELSKNDLFSPPQVFLLIRQR